jgi:pimeloyl-ACP methyl ester carboxylesterase
MKKSPWYDQIGSQRDWVWRGWQVRYTYLRADKEATLEATQPLLLLHGFASALTQWRANLLPLSQQHTVYALDFLGFGASEKAAIAYKTELWVEQTYDFWRTFIRQPVVLIGHSLGGLVALATAVAHPEMIKGLVLITLPAARQELLSGKMLAIAGACERLFANPILLRPVFWLLRQPRVLRSILRLAYANHNHLTEELVLSFLEPALDQGAAEVFFRLAKARTQTDYSPETQQLLPQLQKPTLLLWGQQDRIIPPRWGKQFFSLNPNLKFVELPNAGHCLYHECADRVNQEILTWIDTHCNTSSLVCSQQYPDPPTP